MIRIPSGIYTTATRVLANILKGILFNVEASIISKEKGLSIGKRAIEDHFQDMLRLSRDYIQREFGYVGELPEAEVRRLEKQRDDYIEDFRKILEDADRLNAAS